METNESITHQVLTHHLTAFGNNDLEEILTDYTEESQVLTIAGPLTGRAAIRQFFADFFVAVPTGSTFAMKQLTVIDHVAHIIWASKSAVANIPLGTDTFFLEGDKIRYHTVADFRINS